jgi:lipopolysaccharide transport system ATP-binding protein
MKPIIKVENLGKRYSIGMQEAAYGTLREKMVGIMRLPFERLRGNGQAGGEQLIWALEDVNFEVNPGEVVGIIGPNGAGKSTLLKLLSRITEPTTGRIDLYGRIGSLLEVGTGFHAELTGRENIYLNGAILGLRKTEIERKFDEIVSFAEIGKFLDTPVKRYSSGMYMRLAFAVAAHLEPEILIVDEVLAVGDAAFQRKCLGKMGDVAKQGRTVIFVSHNMGAISSLCSRCLLIKSGSLFEDGEVSKVTALYQSSLYSTIDDASDLSSAEHYGTGKARFTSVSVVPLNGNGEPQPFLQTGERLTVEVSISAFEEITSANVALVIYDSSGYRLIDVNTALKGSFLSLQNGQVAQVQFELEEVLLRPGVYLLGLWLGRIGVEDIDGITYATSFSVEAAPETLLSSEKFPGVYQCRHSHMIRISESEQTASPLKALRV